LSGTEWSLILFTLLIQAGVGLFVLSETTLGSLAKKFNRENLRPRHLYPSVLSLAFVVVGIAVSFFHLGSPRNAYLTLNNWQSSWLSREILFLILFTALLTVVSFLRWKNPLSSSIHDYIAVLTCASGLALIFSMSRLYMLSTVPPWNTFGTPIAFFITAFLLGGQIYGLILISGKFRYQDFPKEGNGFAVDWKQKTSGRLIRFSLVLVILQLGFAFLFDDRFFSSEPVSAAGASHSHLHLQLSFAIRIGFLITAALLLVILLLRMRKTGAEPKGLRILAYGIFSLILVSEILGRYIFFAAYYRLGL
jgi:anaerobic dimethyl sulfoxide reductase subunit C (anchor subunit)